MDIDIRICPYRRLSLLTRAGVSFAEHGNLFILFAFISKYMHRQGVVILVLSCDLTPSSTETKKAHADSVLVSSLEAQISGRPCFRLALTK